MITASILRENKAYWTIRAPGYSEVNRLELQGDQRERWKSCLAEEFSRHFKGRALTDLHILEAGTGPGFFAILLAELGARVAAIDLTPALLREALENAGPHAGTITFLEMDAQALAFADASFDAVISRNLTWNLPDPAKALAEWTRVLKPGGLLLNFDANWYAYLFDENARAAYEQDRLNTKVSGVPDQNIGERFDVMEALAFKMPLSPLARPAWDLAVLTSLGLSPEADCGVWQRVWSDEEKLNFASTPLFLVRAKKNLPAGCNPPPHKVF